MGLRVKRYGPLSTMVVVGRLVGTFEPALVIVTIAEATSTMARINTIAPSQPAGRLEGSNGKGTSQLSASPAMTAIPHAEKEKPLPLCSAPLASSRFIRNTATIPSAVDSH